MECVIFSIKPRYVELIFDGIKKYEYRKNRIRTDVSKIIIYCTFPVKKVVGEATIQRVIQGSPEYVWAKTCDSGGIDKDFFYQYYLNKAEAVAYELVNVVRYSTPLELLDFGVRIAPQSYTYVQLP